MVSFSAQAMAQGDPPTISGRVAQLVVSVADGWNSSGARMVCYQRTHERAPWKPVLFSKSIPVLLGKSGLGWGLGVLPRPAQSKAPIKKERDKRAPAGCFVIGRILGNPSALPEGSQYPYRQITKWDAWVDDVNNPYYNQHYVADPNNVPPWFNKQKMRHGDAAYTYLVEIQHNTNPIVKGAGSAIFFHIRRGPSRVTSGCTTMEKKNLVAMIQWLRPQDWPHYVLLPKAEYVQLSAPWKLPSHPSIK